MAFFRGGLCVAVHWTTGLVTQRLLVAAALVWLTRPLPVCSADLLTSSGARRTKTSWPLSFTSDELRKRLTPLQYHVTQERGTESAFSGVLGAPGEEGSYSCVVCGSVLFSSQSKFDSGSGWPSFSDVLNKTSVSVEDDFSYGMHRVEAACSQCGAHLGHLFDDGPKPSGKRYCINSASLAFQPRPHQQEAEQQRGATGVSSQKNDL